jgi:hypothetical protein
VGLHGGNPEEPPHARGRRWGNGRKYIANQREHHKKRDFAAELALLLKKHGLDFNK